MHTLLFRYEKIYTIITICLPCPYPCPPCPPFKTGPYVWLRPRPQLLQSDGASRRALQRHLWHCCSLRRASVCCPADPKWIDRLPVASPNPDCRPHRASSRPTRPVAGLLERCCLASANRPSHDCSLPKPIVSFCIRAWNEGCFASSACASRVHGLRHHWGQRPSRRQNVHPGRSATRWPLLQHLWIRKCSFFLPFSRLWFFDQLEKKRGKKKKTHKTTTLLLHANSTLWVACVLCPR